MFAYLIVVIVSYWRFSGYREEKNHHKKNQKKIQTRMGSEKAPEGEGP